ncbi:adenylate/guanylate cyclase domain-containing protein [Nitratireductor sp. XY-223]|uniref:adenylate/guanylate cyclase domain-containing protein n=1 Tax=Nitratireductor sp. XY-223 TaxID=2561926 RepID=UPI0010AADCAB|nr:adenylate/guanylate cyclase domain-containing protein [Nitratireductor sp. XY-223]
MERRLAAVLAADVVGYTRMIGADEAGALAALRAFRTEVFGPTVAGHHGKIVKSMGDGWLVVFSSVVEAVNCAVQVQDRLTGHPLIALRIGVHIGDVVHEDEDIFGDGVNVAARLEALAEPGGIAVSDPAYSGLDGTLTPSFVDAGEQTLKNVAKPMRVWTKATAPSEASNVPMRGRSTGYPHLAILPVATSDERTDVRELAEGLTGDLDATLAAVRWLVVAVSERQQARGYVLKSALRSRGDRLRLEARLFEPGGTQIWAGKFDGDLANSFDWQDGTAEAVAFEVITRLLDAERDRMSRIRLEDRTAEECLVQGFMQLRLGDSQSFADSLSSYVQAIEKDADLADAYGEAIWTTYAGMSIGLKSVLPFYEKYFPDWVARGSRLTGRSPVLGIGIALANFKSSSDAAPLRNAIADALRVSASDANVLHYAAWCSLWCGETSTALDCFRKFERFGKAHPFSAPAKGGAAIASLQLGDDATAIRMANEGLELSSTYASLYSVLAAAYANSGQPEKAAAALSAYRELVPDRTISSWKAMNDYGGSAGGERYFDGLRKAGLPE